MATRFSIVLILSALASVYPAHGAICNDTQTLDGCFNAVSASKQTDALVYSTEVDAKVFEQHRALSVTTTGDVPVNAFGSQVSLNDLLALLNIAVDPGTDGDNGERVSIEYSPVGEYFGGDFKLGVATATPALSAAVRTAINDSTIADGLEKQLKFGDDLNATLNYSFSGHMGGILFGRSNELLQTVLTSLAASPRAATNRPPKQRLAAIALEIAMNGRYQLAGGETFAKMKIGIGKAVQPMLKAGNTTFLNVAAPARPAAELEQIHAPCRPLLANAVPGSNDGIVAALVANCLVDNWRTWVETDALAEVESLQQFRAALTATGFFKVGSLVNNQPQLVISANIHNRDKLAGGDKYGLTVALEFDMSGKSISSLNRRLGKDCWKEKVKKPTAQQYEQCAGQISSFIKNDKISLEGWRLSSSLKYMKSDAANLSFPGTTATFTQDKAESTIFSLVAGRFVGTGLNGLPGGKIDIGASYENVSGDPMRQDRGAAHVTFTQQLAAATHLTIGLVWANRPEYRVDTDDDLSARLGLNYKFGPPAGQ